MRGPHSAGWGPAASMLRSGSPHHLVSRAPRSVWRPLPSPPTAPDMHARTRARTADACHTPCPVCSGRAALATTGSKRSRRSARRRVNARWADDTCGSACALRMRAAPAPHAYPSEPLALATLQQLCSACHVDSRAGRSARAVPTLIITHHHRHAAATLCCACCLLLALADGGLHPHPALRAA